MCLRETTPKSTVDVEEREGTSSVESQSRSGFASDQRGPLEAISFQSVLFTSCFQFMHIHRFYHSLIQDKHMYFPF